MSVEVMALVWKGSSHKGSELLVLLALADWSNDQGESVFPSIERIAEKTRLSARAVQYNLRRLEQSGEISINPQGHVNQNGQKTNEYTISVEALRGAKIAGVQNHVKKGCKILQKGVQPIAPNPSVSVIDPSLGEASASRATLNAVTATPVATYGVSMTPTPAQHDMLEDTFNRHLKAQQKPNETIIKAWNLQPHLEHMCLWFAEDTGVIVTKADKGKWSAGARSNNELHPTRQQHTAAVKRFKAQRNKDGQPLTLTHPQALYQTLKQVMEEQAHVQQATNVDYVEAVDALGNIVYKAVTR